VLKFGFSGVMDKMDFNECTVSSNRIVFHQFAILKVTILSITIFKYHKFSITV